MDKPNETECRQVVHDGQPGLFVHIRKTAGISIRDALEDNYRVICDYGVDGPRTSDIIRKYKYQQHDPYAIYRELQRTDSWLVGHFNLQQFSDFVDCRRILTFVRHPVDRVISHFNHIRAYVSADRQLEVFAQNKKARNLQYRALKSMPLGCIGYVGIAERFDESLEMINAGLGLSLEFKHANINRHKTLEKEDVTQEMRELIAENNPLDMALYERAVAQHEQRYRFFREGRLWCHG
ncbi:MAG: sulfotransferase family 2 domain-containing protein [Halioglobus sp.]|nr:sulfotransferase family 2 domain-containing protein [Halioglobus sp.]